MKYLKELKTINDLSKHKDLVPTKYTLEALNNILDEYRPYEKEGMTYADLDILLDAEGQIFFLSSLEPLLRSDPDVYKTFEKLHHIIMFRIVNKLKTDFVDLYQIKEKMLDFSGNLIDYSKFKENLDPITKKKMILREFLEPLMNGNLDFSFGSFSNGSKDVPEVRVNVYNMNWHNGEESSEKRIDLEYHIIKFEHLLSKEEKEAGKFGI